MAIGIGWLLNGYRNMLRSFRASLMDIGIVRYLSHPDARMARRIVRGLSERVERL